MSEPEAGLCFAMVRAKISPLGVVWGLRLVWGMKPGSELQCGLQLEAEKVQKQGSETGRGLMTE